MDRWFNEPKYRYVAPDSKGAQGSNPNTFPGFQVQWYSNKTKRTKRLGNVQHTEIGALMRVAASIDLRLLFDEDVRLNFYESTVRWVQWIAAQDVEDAAARKEESFRRAAQWLSEVDASLQSLRVYRPSQTKRGSVSSAVDNSFAEILDNDDRKMRLRCNACLAPALNGCATRLKTESFLLNAIWIRGQIHFFVARRDDAIGARIPR